MYYHLQLSSRGQEGINVQTPSSTNIQLLLVLGKRVASDGDTPKCWPKKKVRKIENMMVYYQADRFVCNREACQGL